MPFIDYVSENNCLIGIWENSESVEDLLLLYQPNKDELKRFNTIKLEKRQKEFLITRLLLLQLMEKKIVIEKDENGKPFIPDQKTRISITHADKYSAVMKHDLLECGVDMEAIEKRIERIAPKFASDYEQLYVTEGRTQLHYTIVWCIKEAVYKWYAKGNVDFKQQIMLHPFTADREMDPGKVYLEFMESGERQVLTAYYKVIDDNVLAWVAG